MLHIDSFVFIFDKFLLPECLCGKLFQFPIDRICFWLPKADFDFTYSMHAMTESGRNRKVFVVVSWFFGFQGILHVIT